MSRVRPLAAGVLVAGVAISLAAALLSAREARHAFQVSPERFLYLRSSPAAARLFLQFDALASDVYWLRTIQHYGRDRRSSREHGRFELLAPLLDLTTTLDPYFNIVYRFGAIFLSMEAPNGPGRTDQAVALLEKGLKTRPDRWQYAHDIGFIHYWHTGNYKEAAAWFERAAAMPGAPEWLPALAAVTLATGGDRAGARQLLEELRTSDEPYLRQAAQRGLAQLQALDAIDYLQSLVERFHQAAGRYPASWMELVRSGLLPGLPADPTGTPFSYSEESHLVSLSPASPLGPLPRGLENR